MIKYVQDKRINYKRVKQLLDKSVQLSRFTNGGPVKVELESLLADILDIGPDKKVVCTNNGTTALHALMFLLERLYGDIKWATTAYNFPSPVINGFDTEIIDIELTDNGYKIPIESLKPYSGFTFPTLFGTTPDNLNEILDYWKKTDRFFLVLDNASSPLSKGNSICNLGDASFGSLHHTKYLGFGEGGFLVVDKEHYTLADSITNFGFLQSRQFNQLSSNFKISDISAAFIISHINGYKIAEHIQIQNKLVKKLRENGITPFAFDEEVIYGNLPVKFDKPTSHLVFRDYGIEANKYYVPLDPMALNSKHLYDRLVNFPLHAKLLNYEIDKLVEQICYVRDQQK